MHARMSIQSSQLSCKQIQACGGWPSCIGKNLALHCEPPRQLPGSTSAESVKMRLTASQCYLRLEQHGKVAVLQAAADSLPACQLEYVNLAALQTPQGDTCNGVHACIAVTN